MIALMFGEVLSSSARAQTNFRPQLVSTADSQLLIWLVQGALLCHRLQVCAARAVAVQQCTAGLQICLNAVNDSNQHHVD